MAVLANGRIGFTGEKGLGGKQVWLRDTKRGQSLYYAHLDSIAKTSGSVKTGDTLGFVGNTGNARTTPPHLHFGIYKFDHQKQYCKSSGQTNNFKITDFRTG